ncbi:MAG: family 10 glycosylhydrolase [Planctomycetes bacterium]|nr:family 10 glycosylhydrolase [Planctomycetota bacterium]
MLRPTRALLSFALALAACSLPQSPDAAAQPASAAPAAAAPRSSPAPGTGPRAAVGPTREFRGAWVATVDNIDFPSRPGLPVAALQAELDQIVRRAAELGLNALVFQVRPAADAFYRSPLEPWSEWLTGAQGRAPAGDFDPLAYVIARCHERSLQLHAWFNPFRASHPAGKSPAAASHVTRRAPELCVRYGKHQWMDPGDATAVKWTLAVIQDVVRRYDVDGVHVDDYFYPYPEGKAAFPDARSFERYQGSGGRLSRDDWRRRNIDDFVRTLYELVHREKPWVLVGISPFGIARPGVPAGIEAGLDQYAQLYADVPKWLREGWLDYLSPQLYWPIDDRPHAFDALLAYWHAHNPKDRAIWPGLSVSRLQQPKPPARHSELRDQVLRTRAAANAHPGHVLFSFRALRDEAPQLAGTLRELYQERAAVPALPSVTPR